MDYNPFDLKLHRDCVNYKVNQLEEPCKSCLERNLHGDGEKPGWELNEEARQSQSKGNVHE